MNLFSCVDDINDVRPYRRQVNVCAKRHIAIWARKNQAIPGCPVLGNASNGVKAKLQDVVLTTRTRGHSLLPWFGEILA